MVSIIQPESRVVDALGTTASVKGSSNAFSNTAGELRVESSGGLVHVLADVNGDGAADMVIHLYNVLAPPPASDFVL